MDLDFSYNLPDGVTLNVGYGEFSQHFFAEVYQLLESGYQYHLSKGHDPNTTWYTSIDPLLHPISQTLDELGLNFSIPNEDLEKLRARVSFVLPEEAQDAEIIPLGMTDSEYLALLSTGYDPVYEEEIWSLEVVRQDLMDFATLLFANPNWEAEFESLMVEQLIQLGSEVGIFPSDRGCVLRHQPLRLKESEKNRVDLWIEAHFGIKLSEFPGLIRAGINPVDRQPITFYIPYDLEVEPRDS